MPSAKLRTFGHAVMIFIHKTSVGWMVFRIPNIFSLKYWSSRKGHSLVFASGKIKGLETHFIIKFSQNRQMCSRDLWSSSCLTHLDQVVQVCVCQWTESSLVQVMACRLFGVKPIIIEPNVGLLYLSVEFEAKFKLFHSTKCIWKCRPQHLCHLVIPLTKGQ